MIMLKSNRHIFRFLLVVVGVLAISFPVHSQINCRDELTKKIKALLLADDGKVLMQASNIATLKLNLKMLRSGSSRDTLENHVREQMKKLKKQDKRNLIGKVKALYRQYGEIKTESEVQRILNGLDEHNYFPKAKRLSNKESAVIMLAYELIDPDPSEFKIDENDVAITWFMDELERKTATDTKNSALSNRLRTSVKVAHTAGVFKQNRALTELEVRTEIKEIEELLNKKLAKLVRDFKAEFSFCYHVLGGDKCIEKMITPSYEKSLSDLTKELKKSKYKTRQVVTIDEKTGEKKKELKVQLLDNLTLSLKSALVERTSDNSKSVKEKGSKALKPAPTFPTSMPEMIDGERPGTCSGVGYEAEVRNVRIDGYDSVRGVGMGLAGAATGSFTDPVNKFIGEKFRKAVDNKIAKGGAMGKFLRIFCPPFPVAFKCYPYVKLWKKSIKKGEAKVCCNNELEWQPFKNKFTSFTGGVEVKVYWGLPDYIPFIVAEVGILGGLAVSYVKGGGDLPEGCGTKNCASNALRLNAYIGAYLDFGVAKDKWKKRNIAKKSDRMPAGVGAELKVSWRPNATIRQCSYPNGNIETPKMILDMGKGYLNGTFYLGWIYSKDVFWELWDSPAKTTFDVPIF